MVWRYLRNRQLDGLKFVRQQPIGPYYVDFVCRERRDSYLAAEGYRVICIWNNDALQNMKGVFEFLALELAKIAPHPPVAARRAPPSSRAAGRGVK